MLICAVLFLATGASDLRFVLTATKRTHVWVTGTSDDGWVEVTPVLADAEARFRVPVHRDHGYPNWLEATVLESAAGEKRLLHWLSIFDWGRAPFGWLLSAGVLTFLRAALRRVPPNEPRVWGRDGWRPGSLDAGRVIVDRLQHGPSAWKPYVFWAAALGLPALLAPLSGMMFAPVIAGFGLLWIGLMTGFAFDVHSDFLTVTSEGIHRRSVWRTEAIPWKEIAELRRLGENLVWSVQGHDGPVAGFTLRDDLRPEAAFDRLLEEARRRGIRVVRQD